MIPIKNIDIYSDERVITISLEENNRFSNAALCGILSLYITSYGQMLRSKKSILLYKQFITDTKNRIGNFILKCNQNQADVLKQILNQIRLLEDDKIIHSYDRIDLNKLSILMNSDSDISDLSDFYIPFLKVLNNEKNYSHSFDEKIIFIYIDNNNLQITVNKRISSFRIENEEDEKNIIFGDYLSEERTVTPGFVDCNFQFIQDTSFDSLRPIKEPGYICPFLKYVFSFNFIVIDKISIYDLISFFKLFSLIYFPDSKNGLGITKFTFFDFIGSMFTDKIFDFKNLSILEANLFAFFLNKNNINLNTVNFKSEDKNVNIAGINLRNFFSKFDNLFNKGTEALDDSEEEEKIEDPPKKEEEITPKADLDKEEDPPKEEEEEAPIDDEKREEVIEDLESDPNKEENEVKEKIEDRPSPINFKLELNNENETHEDLIYKQYAYNHIRNLMKQQNIDSKIISLMKIITNQWLFLLSTKTVKTIIKNLEKIIIKGETNEQG